MIKIISKPKPAPDAALAATQLLVSAPKKRVGVAIQRPGKVAFQEDMIGGAVAQRAPAAGGIQRKPSFVKNPTSGQMPSSKPGAQAKPKPQQNGLGLAPYVIGLVVLIILLIVGIVGLNNVNKAPTQTWQGGPVVEVPPEEPARPMKEYMQQHGGGSQALKDRKNRVRGDGRQGATFVHNTKTGESRDLESSDSAPSDQK